MSRPLGLELFDFVLGGRYDDGEVGLLEEGEAGRELGLVDGVGGGEFLAEFGQRRGPVGLDLIVSADGGGLVDGDDQGFGEDAAAHVVGDDVFGDAIETVVAGE